MRDVILIILNMCGFELLLSWAYFVVAIVPYVIGIQALLALVAVVAAVGQIRELRNARRFIAPWSIAT